MCILLLSMFVVIQVFCLAAPSCLNLLCLDYEKKYAVISWI